MQALILLEEESPWIDLEKHFNRKHVCMANTSCFLINHRGEIESDITVLFTKRRSIIAPKAHDNYRARPICATFAIFNYFFLAL